jgi:hypothetical protein
MALSPLARFVMRNCTWPRSWVISAPVIFAGALGAAAPDIWIDQYPELATLDETARIRAREVVRVVGTCFFLLGVVGLWNVLAGR